MQKRKISDHFEKNDTHHFDLPVVCFQAIIVRRPAGGSHSSVPILLDVAQILWPVGLEEAIMFNILLLKQIQRAVTVNGVE